MNESRGIAIIRENTEIKGDISNCSEIEIFGVVEGRISAGSLKVHHGGRVHGVIKVDQAEVYGIVDGDVTVKQLIRIGSSGSVTGNVRYGRLSMDEGADLTARVRNIPPTIAGDLEIAVEAGRSVRITDADLSAIDPDDVAADLTFTVSNARHGSVVMDRNPSAAILRFTQADLNAGQVRFQHDGSATDIASFDVVVADPKGGTSGTPQTVKVAVYTRAA